MTQLEENLQRFNSKQKEYGSNDLEAYNVWRKSNINKHTQLHIQLHWVNWSEGKYLVLGKNIIWKSLQMNNHVI